MQVRKPTAPHVIRNSHVNAALRSVDFQQASGRRGEISIPSSFVLLQMRELFRR